jgi:uncharacterized glyoxalase superfamily protein PhnB
MSPRTPMISTMRYRDATAAVDWLCRVFGFEKLSAYTDKAGKIMHAELSFGNGLIMIGPVADTPFGKFMIQPDEVGGKVTQTIYAIVPDPDAHCTRAKAAGANILMEPKTQDYSGRDYSCRDIEGHVWSFGTYDPWTAPKA